MDSDNENIKINKKCGYCGCVLNDMSVILNHSCFKNYYEDSQYIYIDENYTVIIVACEKNPTENLQNNRRWNKDWDELLIKEVSNRPALFNYRLPLLERTNLKKKNLWMEIYNCLGGPCEVKYIQNRWKNLQDMPR